MFRTRVSLWDGIAIGTVLFCAVLLLIVPLLGRGTGETLAIRTSEGISEYLLGEDREIPISANGYTLTVVIKDRRAWVRESDCADGICRDSRPISRTGESILCAPAGVTLTVRGGDGDVDFVAG